MFIQYYINLNIISASLTHYVYYLHVFVFSCFVIVYFLFCFCIHSFGIDRGASQWQNKF